MHNIHVDTEDWRRIDVQDIRWCIQTEDLSAFTGRTCDKIRMEVESK